jgi:hypothetical protein
LRPRPESPTSPLALRTPQHEHCPRHRRAHWQIDVRVTGLPEAKAAGEHLAATSARDAVDALVALAVVPGDQLLTSDPEDLRALIGARTIPVTVVTV